MRAVTPCTPRMPRACSRWHSISPSTSSWSAPRRRSSPASRTLSAGTACRRSARAPRRPRSKARRLFAKDVMRRGGSADGARRCRSHGRRAWSRPTGSPPARASWSAGRRRSSRQRCRPRPPSGSRSSSRNCSRARGVGLRTVRRRARRPAAGRAGLQARLDGDEGPNTGGMGSYAPAPDVDVHELVERDPRRCSPSSRDADRRSSASLRGPDAHRGRPAACSSSTAASAIRRRSRSCRSLDGTCSTRSRRAPPGTLGTSTLAARTTPR